MNIYPTKLFLIFFFMISKDFNSGIRKRFLEVVSDILNRGAAKNNSEIATVIAIAPSNFSLITSQEDRTPTVYQIAMICEKYDYSVNYIISGRGGMRAPSSMVSSGEYAQMQLEKLEIKVKNLTDEVNILNRENKYLADTNKDLEKRLKQCEQKEAA